MQSSFQRILACAGIALLLGTLSCAPPDRTDHSPDDLIDDSSGVNLPPASTGDDDDHGGGTPAPPGDDVGGGGGSNNGDGTVVADDDDATDTSDCEPVGPETEPGDDILDCNEECSPAAWLADGECDEVFNCEALFFDLQDCE
jgi:hypothetical protein